MSRPGGRRFNNRGYNPRGGNSGRGQPMNYNNGFQFSGHSANPANQGNFRPHVNKPQLCSFFQQGGCTNPNCTNLHQYSFHNEVSRLQMINANSLVFAACLIGEAQLAISIAGKIIVYNIQTATVLAEFAIPGKTRQVLYTTDIEPGFLLFCGESHGAQMIGAISLSGAIVNFPNAHTSGTSCMMAKRGLVFVGGDDSKVSVWFYSGQAFELGMIMEMDAALQNSITCISLVQNFVIAGLASGLVVGWEYNFDNNQYI